MIRGREKANGGVLMRMRMTTRWGTALAVLTLVLALLASGCATMGAEAEPTVPLLRVGVAPDYPPLVFVRDEQIVGVDADLAHELATVLGRRVEFVPLRFDQLIPALLDGHIDIIMSALSVTKARELRVAFSTPYLDNGLLALMRIRDARLFDSREKIVTHNGAIGVKGGTTGELFVRKNCPRARPITLGKPADAVYELRRGSIDLFIHDGYYIAWLLSAHEADFTVLRTPLTEESLAWGLRRTDADLLGAANAALARWKADGTLQRILDRWLPNVRPSS
jgi:ABC-type amino acid transport substrate-binding protein